MFYIYFNLLLGTFLYKDACSLELFTVCPSVFILIIVFFFKRGRGGSSSTAMSKLKCFYQSMIIKFLSHWVLCLPNFDSAQQGVNTSFEHAIIIYH